MTGARPQAAGTSRTSSAWRAVIGLEVHCQLRTRTKLFCGCLNAFGAPPNTLVCPLCSAQPGALPVLNAEAVALAVRAALALGARVAPESVFARKNYFYPDLPKGYQISQYETPLATGGQLVLAGGRTIRLRRIHMEEDAGKAIHDRGNRTLVDLNRAGVPLIELVTEPDLESSAEAHELLSALKEILQYTGVSDCDMEKGSLRCDVNVSVHRAGEPLGTRVELKNLNSFRHVVLALEYEIARQVQGLESGDRTLHPRRETRLFDVERGETRAMRSKEDEEDYRYFPDPDLPHLVVGAELLERERHNVPELPAARRARFRREFDLSEKTALVLTASRALADFFEETARLAGDAQEAANWTANEISALLGDPEIPARRIEDLALSPRTLADVIGLVASGEIHRHAARTLLRGLIGSGKGARELVRELGLLQVTDAAEIERWCRAALAGRDAIVADVRRGETKALGALVGPVMKVSGGRANPALVQETLLRLIREGDAR